MGCIVQQSSYFIRGISSSIFISIYLAVYQHVLVFINNLSLRVSLPCDRVEIFCYGMCETKCLVRTGFFVADPRLHVADSAPQLCRSAYRVRFQFESHEPCRTRSRFPRLQQHCTSFYGSDVEPMTRVSMLTRELIFGDTHLSIYIL